MTKKRDRVNFFGTDAPEMPSFGTGEASEILGIPIWRLQKFVDSQIYNLWPAGQLGRGPGSRRVFSREDLHRIALANWLVRDGFSPQFVGSVVEQLEDDEVGVYVDREGEEQRLSLSFYRGADGPVIRVSKVGLASKYNQPPYYRLDFADVFREVDARIEKLKK
jgi:DNA-binding transcriptional MerR regulator